MKTKKLLLAFFSFFSLISYSQDVMILNLEGDGTDKYIENRYTQNDLTGAPALSVVDNPLKTERNGSNKVLQLSTSGHKGMFGVGLRGYWDPNYGAFVHYTNPQDTIKMYDLQTKTPVFDRLKFKYYVTGNNQATLPIYVEFYDYSVVPQPSSASKPGTWTYTFEGASTWTDWNELIVDISGINTTTGRMLFYAFNQWTAVPGVTIYIDDIELYNSATTALPELKDSEVKCAINEHELTLSNLNQKSNINITDICGKQLYSTKVNSSTFNYSFSKSGIYIISVSNDKSAYVKKILIK